MNHVHNFLQIPRCSLAQCECGKTIYRENEIVPRKVMVESEGDTESVSDVEERPQRQQLVICNQ